jgi:hypothetical protein
MTGWISFEQPPIISGMANTNALDRPTPAALRYVDNMIGAEVATMDDEHDALAYMAEKKREEEERAKTETDQHVLVEGLEMLAAIGCGGIASMGAAGPWINYVLGGVAKATSAFVNPEHPVLRSTVRAGKTLLHGQMAITTRDLIRGKTP